MKKKELFPCTKFLLADIPAEALGVSPKTLQRRRRFPQKVTLEELQRLIKHATAKGDAPVDLIRELIRRDLTI